jgi:hypothetical protein
METWMIVVGSIVGALVGAFAFLAWAVFRCGEEPIELVEYERMIGGCDL